MQQNIQQNIGRVDRYMRLVGGLVALAATGEVRRNPLARAALVTFGAMKVAEGVTGWCPLTHMVDSLTSAQSQTSGRQARSTKDRGNHHSQPRHTEAREASPKRNDEGHRASDTEASYQ